jgi:polyvinyl alcohol dehydrogenase (cytochrome)
VVDGVVYEGSWDGYFYAVDLHTGALRWKFQLHAQPAVTPQQGAKVRDITSDGGMVTSSAWFEPAQGHQPDLVIFGGGYTLYALDAHTGQAVWWHDYTGRPDLPPDPVHDDTRIFSSPVVVGNKVIIGVSVDGEPNKRGYVVAASLETGDPDWVFDTDVDGRGQILNDGCGSVWSSGTVLPKLGAVVFDLADCHFGNPPPLSESVIALRINDGHLVWSYRPSRPDVRCDLDFGATANAGLSAAGQAVFLGVGAKDGTYYSLDPGTGRPRWSTNVVFGGFSGGFIATLAYDGRRVYGSTSIGDFGRFEHGTTVLCDPADPRDVAMQEPSAHAFDATTGGVVWQATNAASFGPTTVAGGMTFHGLILTPAVEVRDAATGTVLAHLSLPALCWSGIATVGDALVLGTGAPPGRIARRHRGVHPGRKATGMTRMPAHGSSDNAGAQATPLMWLPPSTKRVLPVRYRVSSLAKKATTGAMSVSASPRRPMGLAESTSASSSGLSAITRRNAAVLAPGQTALTTMP